MTRRFAAALAALLVAGGGARTAAAATVPLTRLSPDVRPTFQAVTLEVDARRPDYRGRTVIDLDVRKPTRTIALYALDMTLTRIELRGPAGPVAVDTSRGARGRLELTAPRELAPGAYRLEIEFANDFNRRATALYRVDLAGDSYTFTQLEAEDARGAFPCFDEPEFKQPWQVTLVVPAADRAYSNTPIESATLDGDTKRVVFGRTPPLPSYLLAIATGPLDEVPLAGMSVPGHIVVPRGQGPLAAVAARMAPPLLGALEDWFGRPYPYAKLDLIAAPEFWPGAMENPGAIVFADQVLLCDSTAASVEKRKRMASVIAHEMAHMWFGDLVTMEWWDDLWLNESFASWMGEKTTARVFPGFGTALSEVRDADDALRADARLHTRAIRQPVNRLENLLQSADVLAYKKGETVLGMFERWIGPDSFRRGVRDYLAAHQWGNATASDLWSALTGASGQPVGVAMATFLDQPGVPLVTVEPLPGGRVRLSQERLYPAGAPREAPQTWRVPVALRIGHDGTSTVRVVLLERASQEFDTGIAHPEWLHPDADAAGYYRWRLPPADRAALLDHADRLDARERMDLVYDSGALLAAGLLHADDHFDVLRRAAHDPEPGVVSAALDGLTQAIEPFRSSDLRVGLAAYLREALTPALDRLGWLPRAGEAETAALLRPRLLRMLAQAGEDARARAFGDSLARAWLADPAAVDPSLVESSLEVAALGNDRALRDEYRRRFETARDPSARRMFLSAAGAFPDPGLQAQALDYALSGPLRPQELRVVQQSVAASSPDGADRVFAWVRSNWDAIVRRVPPMYVTFLPRAAGGCSAARLAEARAFFGEPAHSPPGLERELAKVVEDMESCLALRERELARVRAYFARAAGAAP